MSAINLKSIIGITSITTPAGVDNVFTVHTNDTTERFRVDSNGNQRIAGILTVAQDLDVDGHTNLDNVSIAGVTSTSDNVRILGTNKLQFADNQSLQIYYDNSSYITNNNAGHLFLKTLNGGSDIRLEANDDIFLLTAAGTRNSIICRDYAQVELYYNNTKRLETTNTGVTVTGTVAATSYTGDGSNLTGITGTTINNNANNRIITGSGSANTLNGEANLTFNSSLVVTDGNGTVTTGGNYINLKRTSGNTNYINAPQSNAELVISADKDIIFRTVHTGDFNSSERARINTSGNVMIGRTDGVKKFSVKESSTSSGVYIAQTIGGSSAASGYAVGLGFDPEGYSNRNKIAIVAEGTGNGYSRGKLHFLLDNNNNGDEVALNDSRMFITDDGQIGMGAPSSYSDPYRLYLRYYYSGGAGYANGLVIDSRPDVLSTKHIRFYYASHGSGGGSELGSVTSNNAGSVSYNTSSDYRRKKNDVAITDGIVKVKSLRPIRFNWIEQPEITEEGFFAHEAQEVVPNSVFGEKDALDNDGKPDYQVMDHSKLVPLLTASIQELIAKVEKLEEDNIALRTRVTTLEGN